ncbi:hypothetical protein EV421DRAFT_514832 [Armillaria borealis]|uniref:F-box domain-containing protein n=1 Tax=Armillaria borealis TaxID=47425 RepID=A0AA39JJD2_9AGAR|nr:hypothetical protein EV421DRAFT_514832 [Armillaria borealis]
MAPRRSRAGKLEGILDMPPEVWLEISSHLAPQDLLQLSRSSKDIRRAFMSRSSTAMWKAGRKTVNCPPPIVGFSEPAWANLLFVNMCHFCCKSIVRHIDFVFRTRICSKCKDKAVLTHPEIASNPVELSLIMTLLPTKMTNTRRRGRLPYQLLRREFETVKAHYHSLSGDEREVYCQERRRYVQEITNFVPVGNAWCQEKEAEREREIARLKRDRAAAITQRLNEQGFGKAFSSSEFIFKFHRHPLVKQSRLLTRQGWANISAPLIELAREASEKQVQLEEASRYREYKSVFNVCASRGWKRSLIVACEHASVVESRLALAKAAFDSSLPPGSPSATAIPSSMDFCTFRLVKDILDLPDAITVSRECFLPLLGLFHQQWMQRTHDELISILDIPHIELETMDEKVAFLQLACNVFACKMCSSRELFYPEMLAHECCTRSRDLFPASVSILEKRCAWNADDLVKHDTLSPFMMTVIRATGLDPASAVVRDIDSLEHYYLCIICQRTPLVDRGSKNMYGWRSFIQHMGMHTSFGDSVTYPEDFEIVPSEIVESCPSNSVQLYAFCWRCVHCQDLSWPATLVGIHRHIRDKHSVPEPRINMDYHPDIVIHHWGLRASARIVTTMA